MASFTAADVKQLRDLTGAGMLDCKKALEEADGNVEQAVELLRIKGAKDVGKRANRTAGNGLIAFTGSTLLELNCETDFVAKTPDFDALAEMLVSHTDKTRPADVDALLASTLEDGRTVQQALDDQAAKIGEKLAITRFATLEAPVAVYLHRKSQDLPPQVGVLVSYTGDKADAARSAGMQIAAMRPKFLSRDEVPDEVIASERRIAEQTAREEGKPEQAISKIVDGRVNAFFKDFVLLEQASVQDSKKTVKQILDADGVTVTRFARFEVGQA